MDASKASRRREFVQQASQQQGDDFTSLPYQNKLIPRAKELRKGATKQENHLWYDFLRSYPVRFQRQKTIDHFIADFYCHAAKLIIELDGSQHYNEQGLARDKERTAILSEYGVAVLRFSNTEVENDFRRVCTVIDSAVNKRMRAFAEALPQSPDGDSPLKEGALTWPQGKSLPL